MQDRGEVVEVGEGDRLRNCCKIWNTSGDGLDSGGRQRVVDQCRGGPEVLGSLGLATNWIW